MTLELNDVMIEGEPHKLSLIAEAGKLTCLTGDGPDRLGRWLLVMLGFIPTTHGFVCIDGEPFSERSAAMFRQFMAYAPACLEEVGEIVRYAPPSVQDVFRLQANAERPISNGILSEEIRQIGSGEDDGRTRLLAVAVLLGKPILLVDNPPAEALSYLQQQARKDCTVIVASTLDAIVGGADVVVKV